ncbi:MAG: hypothetical protein KF819_08515 [Labilithrix sp.]|nr:hypothetical protein [Labilithrix sp.]
MGKKKSIKRSKDTLRGLGDAPGAKPASPFPPPARRKLTLSEPGMVTDPRIAKRKSRETRASSAPRASSPSRRRPSSAPASSRLTLESVPRVARPLRELVKLPLDHKGGFVLSLVDGTRNVEWIIDAAGMTAVDVIIEIEKLILLGAVVV